MLSGRFKRVCVVGSAKWMPNRRSQRIVRSLPISTGAKNFAMAKDSRGRAISQTKEYFFDVLSTRFERRYQTNGASFERFKRCICDPDLAIRKQWVRL